MILAEDVALLLVGDISGKAVVDVTRLDLALAGSVLLELAASGRVDVAGPGEHVKPGHLVVRDSRPTGDPLLDEALRRVAATSPRKPEAMLPVLRKDLRGPVVARLVQRGLLRADERRLLGLFRVRAWPSTGSAHEHGLRVALHEVLVAGRTATAREAGLISMLHAVDRVPRVLGAVGVSARELRRRAKAVGEGGIADKAVRRAIDAVNAATVAAVTAATTASVAASS